MSPYLPMPQEQARTTSLSFLMYCQVNTIWEEGKEQALPWQVSSGSFEQRLIP
ncbi:hypothetical protein Nmel_013475 [Mimus melanotis]